MHSQTFVFQQLSVGCRYWGSCLLVRPTFVLCPQETQHGLEPPFQTILQCAHFFPPLLFFTHEFDKVASESDLDTSGRSLVRWGNPQVFCVHSLPGDKQLPFFFLMQLWNSTADVLLWSSGDSRYFRNSYTFIFNISWSCNIKSFPEFAKTINNMCWQASCAQCRFQWCSTNLHLTFVVLWPEDVVRVLIQRISGEQHLGWAVEGCNRTDN